MKPATKSASESPSIGIQWLDRERVFVFTSASKPGMAATTSVSVRRASDFECLPWPTLPEKISMTTEFVSSDGWVATAPSVLAANQALQLLTSPRLLVVGWRTEIANH